MENHAICKLRKAIYGTLKAAILFWRLLSDMLIEWSYKLNDHDKCVVNKIIIWNVDDLKISNLDKKVVENIIDKLNKKFGE